MRRWKSYRHRFVPWLALNWSTRLVLEPSEWRARKELSLNWQVKQSDSQSSLVKETAALDQLGSLLKLMDHEVAAISVRECRALLRSPASLQSITSRTSRLMEQLWGFSLLLRESLLPGGGKGVFIGGRGVPEGHIVGLYPGTVYLPFEPLLLQSLGNPFIFRCADGWMIDGSHRGISKWIHRSCAYRDVIGHHLSCDPTWLSTNPINPLSIGQFVNNHTRETGPNVEYVELHVPADLPAPWQRLLPNVFYSTPSTAEEERRLLRVIALVTSRTVVPGEELYSSYLTLVTD